MTDIKPHDDEPKSSPSLSLVLTLVGTVADTTWRLFIPNIGLTVLGLLAEKALHTTPWIMIVGIVTGAYLAYVLVKRQIKKVRQ